VTWILLLCSNEQACRDSLLELKKSVCQKCVWPLFMNDCHAQLEPFSYGKTLRGKCKPYLGGKQRRTDNVDQWCRDVNLVFFEKWHFPGMKVFTDKLYLIDIGPNLWSEIPKNWNLFSSISHGKLYKIFSYFVNMSVDCSFFCLFYIQQLLWRDIISVVTSVFHVLILQCLHINIIFSFFAFFDVPLFLLNFSMAFQCQFRIT